ncbi:hypothetical protein HPB50_028624 [Hyalomma asiaticum]|nr:hypothetical protein HPB50_028624 [Hyalomma asiaticum]
MAATKITGYDPATMQWTEVDAKSQNEDLPPTEDECLQALVRLRQRRKQGNTTSGDASDALLSQAGVARSEIPGGARAAPKKGHTKTAQHWRPKQTPRLHSEDLIVVLKPRGTLDLKTAFNHGDVAFNHGATWTTSVVDKLIREFDLKVGERTYPFRGHLKTNGDCCRGVICVREDETSASLKPKLRWREGDRKLGSSNGAVVTFVGGRLPRYIQYNYECVPVRTYRKTIPACYRCGTVGHRVDNCPHPEDGRCGYCGKQVGATADGITEHDCHPSCLICQGAHLTGSAECTGKFRKVQRLGATNKIGTLPRNKQPPPPPPPSPPKMGKQGQQQRQPPQQKAANNTPQPQHTAPRPGKQPPTFQEGDFPSLGTTAKQQVSGWAGTASQSSTSPTPLTLEMHKKLESLQEQNAQLATKIQALEKARIDTPTSRMDDESDSASVCSGSTMTSRPASFENLETRVSNIEQQLLAITEQMAQLPNMITQAVQAAMQLQTQLMVDDVQKIPKGVRDDKLKKRTIHYRRCSVGELFV